MTFNIYKRGQGKHTRLCSAFGLALIICLGCYRLYSKLDATDFGIGTKGEMWIATMVPVILFVVLALIIFWLVNKPSVADFMISAEGEMKKVSWSSRKEIGVSTVVVICVVAIFGVLFWITDLFFAIFFMWLLGK